MARAAAAAPVDPPGPHDTLADTLADMLADMLAKLLTLCLLALATLAAADPESGKGGQKEDSYETVEARLLEGVKLRRGPSYLVPAGHCNVTLSTLELCGLGLVVASLEVKVLNPSQRYADVLFEMRDKHQVRVEVSRCSEPWSLDMRLACLRRKPSRSRSRVPLLLNRPLQ